MGELTREASDTIKKSVDAMEHEMDEIKTKIGNNIGIVEYNSSYSQTRVH